MTYVICPVDETTGELLTENPIDLDERELWRIVRCLWNAGESTLADRINDRRIAIEADQP